MLLFFSLNRAGLFLKVVLVRLLEEISEKLLWCCCEASSSFYTRVFD